jgi:outer membrane protein assembly factor BamB
VIVGGTSASADAIVALKPSGAFFWSFGAGTPVSPVSGNMLYDPTTSTDPVHPTPVLYVAGSSTLFALHVDVLGTPAKVDKFCTAAIGTAVGSPAIVGAGATASVVIADNGATKQITAFSTSNMGAAGGACTTRDFARLAGGQATAEVGPTTASGTTVYYGYNNSAITAGDLGVVSTSFGAGTFSPPAPHALGFAPSTNTGMAVVAIADALFLGNASAKTYHRVNASDFSTGNWTSTAFVTTTNLVAPPTVARGVVLGVSGSPGRVKAMSKADGTSPWTFPVSTSLNAISQVATAPDGTLYFSDSLNNELVALPPDGSSPAWTFTGFTGVTFVGPGTEPTVDANGILYFGADNGNVYAIITDAGTPISGGGSDWPRTGFDRCNSANTAFVCP